MTTQMNSTLPERQLTQAEQNEIETLAKRLNLPSSFTAWHFILEAVAYHRKAQQGDRVEG